MAYEAEMNAMIHAGGDPHGDIDHPRFCCGSAGYSDVALAMQEGYSTASDEIRELGFGAGMGLPNIERNSDGMNIETEVGVGTTLTARINFPGQGSLPRTGVAASSGTT